MTLYEFNVLTLEEKQSIVWDKSIFFKVTTQDNYGKIVERKISLEI